MSLTANRLRIARIDARTTRKAVRVPAAFDVIAGAVPEAGAMNLRFRPGEPNG